MFQVVGQRLCRLAGSRNLQQGLGESSSPHYNLGMVEDHHFQANQIVPLGKMSGFDVLLARNVCRDFLLSFKLEDSGVILVVAGEFTQYVVLLYQLAFSWTGVPIIQTLFLSQCMFLFLPADWSFLRSALCMVLDHLALVLISSASRYESSNKQLSIPSETSQMSQISGHFQPEGLNTVFWTLRTWTNSFVLISHCS